MSRLASSWIGGLLAASIVALAAQPSSSPRGSAPDLTKIDVTGLGAHLRFLADDLLEGRAPATRGGDLAARYVAASFEALGLSAGRRLRHLFPAGADPREPRDRGDHDDGDREISEPSVHVSRRPRGHRRHSRAADGGPCPSNAEGSTRNRLRRTWHRRARTQVERLRGPRREGEDRAPAGERSAGDEGEPELFGGRSLTYYGRWTYKYEEAARQGAAGAILVHTDGVGLVSVERGPGELGWHAVAACRRQPARRSSGCKAWMTEDAAGGLRRSADRTSTALRAAAQTRGSRGVDLGVRVAVQISSR